MKKIIMGLLIIIGLFFTMLPILIFNRSSERINVIEKNKVGNITIGIVKIDGKEFIISNAFILTPKDSLK